MGNEKEILMTPEDYAIKNKVSLKTVYNHMNSGKLNTVIKFKKKLIEV